jgi:hypothetical protein
MDHIKIAHYFFKLVEDSDHLIFNDKLIDGIIDYNSLMIQIQKNLPFPKKLRVVIHELLHGLTDLYNISLTEEEVDMLAISVSSFLLDNYSFCEKLLKEIIEYKNSSLKDTHLVKKQVQKITKV